MVVLPIINALMPVILLVALGFFLRKTTFLTPDVWSGLNRFVYWIGVPSLLFHKIAAMSFSAGPALAIFAVLLITTAVVTLLGYAGSRCCPVESRGAIIQAGFRGNLAYIGLPIVFFSFASLPSVDAERMQGLAVLSIAPLVPIYNILAVIALRRPKHAGETLGDRIKESALSVLVNPFVIGSVAGLIVNAMPIEIPFAVSRAIKATGNTALPLALIGIGVSIATVNIGGNFGRVAFSATLKLIVSPLVAFGLIILFGLDSQQAQIALLLAACPTAAASYVIAQQMRADAALASRAVVVSTIGAFPVFAVILAFLFR